MIRVVILAATIALIAIGYLDRPKPVEAVEVKYCPIEYLAAVKGPDGEWHKVWAQSFGPCYLMDRYENA